jgi:hypothetical protein
MTRWLVALLGSAFLLGCPPERPPWPPWPPGPVEVEERGPGVAEESSVVGDEETRQRGLRVMAAEQRAVVIKLDEATRFSRVSTRMTERVRAALATSDQELTTIERAIDALGREDSLSFDERHARQDELKERLRRLASRLEKMETALREG